MDYTELFYSFLFFAIGLLIYRVVKERGNKVGVNTMEALEILSKFLSASESLHNFIDKDPNKEDKIEILIKACKEAVLCAEELEKLGLLSKEQKKEKVIEFLHVILKTSGIEVTPKVEDLIDLFIEGAVLLKNE